ncbi:MAG TPA: ABC transporter ATP-binding protein [Pirellulaceae bacterium]|nr:ABC transporter ATP-binding protein [Pirellulaceae bacterium]
METHALIKRYGAVTALDECNLGVEAGEVFGLLGPNGAGKTTLMRLLLGYLKPSSGTARIDGLDCHKQSVAVRQRVAYLPAEARLFGTMRGRDVLQFFADVRPGGEIARSKKMAERLELDLSRRVAFMSTGMKQKLALAATMAAPAPLLILDEPTANLDPTIRRIVAEMVSEAREEGRTVMFSSHVLSEVEEICDRVVILRAGRIVHTQVMSELRKRHRIKAKLQGALPLPPQEFQGQLTIRAERQGDVTIETPGELGPLLGWLASLPLDEVRVEPVGLRAVYAQFHSESEAELAVR